MSFSVQRQYIEKACPTGEPPLQCIEGVTSDQPYAARTLKRQSELRYFQQPQAVKSHNFFELRRAAIVAAHGCNHEEGRVVAYPKMAAAMLIGQAEADRACSRYFSPGTPAEKHMLRSVESQYMKAVNGSGVFGTACTDGQARYEAYLMQQRGLSAQFRAKQYPTAAKEAMKFAARKQAFAKKTHGCSYEENLFSKFPIVASAMRPTIGYYPPIVRKPAAGYSLGVGKKVFSEAALIAVKKQEAALYASINGPNGPSSN